MRMSRRPDRTNEAVVTDTPARVATSDNVTLELPLRPTADRSPEGSPLGHRRRSLPRITIRLLARRVPLPEPGQPSRQVSLLGPTRRQLGGARILPLRFREVTGHLQQMS